MTIEEGGFFKGGADGDWVYRHLNGRTAAEGAYSVGQKTGTWMEYHANGQKRLAGGYDARGRRTGEWRGFSKRGAREFVATFVDGELDGPYVQYWPSGDKRGEGSYQKGQLHGPWSFWTQDGSVDRPHRHLPRGDPPPMKTRHMSHVAASGVLLTGVRRCVRRGERRTRRRPAVRAPHGARRRDRAHRGPFPGARPPRADQGRRASRSSARPRCISGRPRDPSASRRSTPSRACFAGSTARRRRAAGRTDRRG